MFAAIDIGTNTALLLVAEKDGRTIRTVHEEQRIPRLGQGVDRERNLGGEAMKRVLDALTEYRGIIDRDFPQVTRTVVTATSAVRDAQNRGDFSKQIKEACGFDLRILSGNEEAEWTYAGALGALDGQVEGTSFVIDIGGGSTELALGNGNSLQDYYSYDIGSVRFTERYLYKTTDLPSVTEVGACRRAIREAFEERPFAPGEGATAIGVAGTVTSLAYLEAGMREYEAEKLNGMTLPGPTVSRWIETLRRLSIREILERYPMVMEGRADVFLAGILILDEFMKRYSFRDLVVSTGGIRHGAILMAGGEESATRDPYS